MAIAENTTTAKCDLTNKFGFFIQGLLAVVAFSTLICKLICLSSHVSNIIEVYIFYTVHVSMELLWHIIFSMTSISL